MVESLGRADKRWRGGGGPRILVLTPHCGEPQLAHQLASLQSQTYSLWERIEIGFRPNKEAHEALYRAVEDYADNFDLFLKLDGDMVLKSETALATVVRFMEERPSLGHAEFAVWDWMTDALLAGVHVYRSGCQWGNLQDSLFVDPKPVFGGRRQLQTKAPAPFVDHMPEPSEEQAFQFGAHRALKAFQPYRAASERRGSPAYIQFRILEFVWQHFSRTGDRRLALALWAAKAVSEGRAGPDGNERKSEVLHSLFREAEGLSTQVLTSQVRDEWGRVGRRRFHWARALGLGATGRALTLRTLGIMRDKALGRHSFPYRPAR